MPPLFSTENVAPVSFMYMWTRDSGTEGEWAG